MTKEEVAKLIQLNFTLYKLGAKPLTDDELKDMLMIWTYQFKDYDGDVVKRAFLEANKKCKFPITVADIFEQMPKENMTKSWEQLKQAVDKAQQYIGWRTCPMLVGVTDDGKPIKSDGSAELQELFDSLPMSAQAWLGSPSALVDKANTPPDELERFERSRFMQQEPETLTAEQLNNNRLGGGTRKALRDAEKHG